MIQGSQEWHQWRKEGVGASETAAVLKVSPWSTPYQVWLDKTGRSNSHEGSFATMRGSEFEAKARALYELFNLEDMTPACAVHPKYSILRASLDGISDDKRKILEIKVPGKETFQMARDGLVPAHYQVQIQQQLLVSGADVCDFFVYDDKRDASALVKVYPDLDMQVKIVSECLDFWSEYVLKDKPPALSFEDTLEVVDNERVGEICAELVATKDSKNKERLDNLKALAIEIAGHNKIKCGNVRISTVMRNGKFSFHKLTIGAGE